MPDVKIKVDVEIIQPKSMDRRFNTRFNTNLNTSSYKLYKSCLTKKELVKLITDEINLEETEMINLIEILNQASLSKAEQPDHRAVRSYSIEKVQAKSPPNQPTTIKELKSFIKSSRTNSQQESSDQA